VAQFDVYRNINETTKELFPYLLDVQNNLFSSLQTRVVVPLILGVKPIKKLNPLFVIEGKSVFMSTADMAGISLDSCGELVLNLEDKRYEVLDALDFLVNGF